MTRERQEQVVTQTQKPTPEEQELQRLQLQNVRATQPQQQAVQSAGLNLINQLLTGQALPGFLEGLPGGVSEDITSQIVQQSLEDVRPGLQQSGLLDSGTRAELETQTAADIRTQAEQFNIQNLLNLLNLTVGGQAQVQAPLLTQTGQLSQSLAGLRPTTTTQTQRFANPFLQNFQQQLGQQTGRGVGSLFF